jgi:acetyltransferase-like isoleucine patch superfamily enzyme
VIALELLWWVGWIWFAAWTALPLLLVHWLGPVAGLAAWALLAPWSALLGMAAVHRMLPRVVTGRHRVFADRGSVVWALKGWAPAMYLTLFQPLFFMNAGFQRLALRAFQARLGRGAVATSRTVIREPHLVRIGRDSLVGEFAHLVCSYQLPPTVLTVAEIVIGDEVLIGAYSHLGPGARVDDRTIVEYDVLIGAGTVVGPDCRIGAGTRIYNTVRIGRGAMIGKNCILPTGTVVAEDARIADGTLL